MSFQDAVKACFSKYAVFKGRASRSEYWYFFLFNILVGICFSSLSITMPGVFGIVSIVYNIAVFIPGLAVCVRRLHDTGKSGFLLLLPYAGIIPMIIGVYGLYFIYYRSALTFYISLSIIAAIYEVVIGIVFLVFLCTASDAGENKYGPNPYAQTAKPSQNDATSTSTNSSVDADELLKLKKLLDDGVISQEDFDTKKKELLGL